MHSWKMDIPRYARSRIPLINGYPSKVCDADKFDFLGPPGSLYEVSDKRATVIANNSKYQVCSLQALLMAFPRIPKGYVRSRLTENRHLFAPTYKALEGAEQLVKQGSPPFQPLACPRPSQHPVDFCGLQKLEKAWTPVTPLTVDEPPLDPLFLRGVHMLQDSLRSEKEEEDRLMANQLNLAEYEETGNLIECGCCFCEYPFEQMVQCEEGHLFCVECARRYADEQIGLRRTKLACLSSDGCNSLFPIQVIQRFLSEKTFALYTQLKQEEELREVTGDDSFESCPFCSFGLYMDTPKEVDRVFKCFKCGVDSCRLCQKRSHIPMSCEEAAKDKVLDLKHTMEEAMTEALVRYAR